MTNKVKSRLLTRLVYNTLSTSVVNSGLLANMLHGRLLISLVQIQHLPRFVRAPKIVEPAPGPGTTTRSCLEGIITFCVFVGTCNSPPAMFRPRPSQLSNPITFIIHPERFCYVFLCYRVFNFHWFIRALLIHCCILLFFSSRLVT